MGSHPLGFGAMNAETVAETAAAAVLSAPVTMSIKLAGFISVSQSYTTQYYN